MDPSTSILHQQRVYYYNGVYDEVLSPDIPAPPPMLPHGDDPQAIPPRPNDSSTRWSSRRRRRKRQKMMQQEATLNHTNHNTTTKCDTTQTKNTNVRGDELGPITTITTTTTTTLEVSPPELDPTVTLSASDLPEGFPDDLAFRALAIYTTLRTLSIQLRLAPFTPHAFLQALLLPYPNRLLGSVHVHILRILLNHLQMGYNWKDTSSAVAPPIEVLKKRKIDGIKWPLRAGDNLLFLDMYTWPLFYDDYCHLTADVLYSAMFDETDHIDGRALILTGVVDQFSEENVSVPRSCVERKSQQYYLDGFIEEEEEIASDDEEFKVEEIESDDDDDSSFERPKKKQKKKIKAKKQSSVLSNQQTKSAMINKQKYDSAMINKQKHDAAIAIKQKISAANKQKHDLVVEERYRRLQANSPANLQHIYRLQQSGQRPQFHGPPIVQNHRHDGHSSFPQYSPGPNHFNDGRPQFPGHYHRQPIPGNAMQHQYHASYRAPDFYTNNAAQNPQKRPMFDVPPSPVRRSVGSDQSNSASSSPMQSQMMNQSPNHVSMNTSNVPPPPPIRPNMSHDRFSMPIPVQRYIGPVVHSYNRNVVQHLMYHGRPPIFRQYAGPIGVGPNWSPPLTSQSHDRETCAPPSPSTDWTSSISVATAQNSGIGRACTDPLSMTTVPTYDPTSSLAFAPPHAIFETAVTRVELPPNGHSVHDEHMGDREQLADGTSGESTSIATQYKTVAFDMSSNRLRAERKNDGLELIHVDNCPDVKLSDVAIQSTEVLFKCGSGGDNDVILESECDKISLTDAPAVLADTVRVKSPQFYDLEYAPVEYHRKRDVMHDENISVECHTQRLNPETMTSDLHCIDASAKGRNPVVESGIHRESFATMSNCDIDNQNSSTASEPEHTLLINNASILPNDDGTAIHHTSANDKSVASNSYSTLPMQSMTSRYPDSFVGVPLLTTEGTDAKDPVLVSKPEYALLSTNSEMSTDGSTTAHHSAANDQSVVYNGLTNNHVVGLGNCSISDAMDDTLLTTNSMLSCHGRATSIDSATNGQSVMLGGIHSTSPFLPIPQLTSPNPDVHISVPPSLSIDGQNRFAPFGNGSKSAISNSVIDSRDSIMACKAENSLLASSASASQATANHLLAFIRGDYRGRMVNSARDIENSADSDDDSVSFPVNEPCHWLHFLPLKGMRKGMSYHHLSMEDKLVILEFLIDELLSVDWIAAEFSNRFDNLSQFDYLYGSKPSDAVIKALRDADGDDHNELCGVCKESGDVICCDGCVSVYHKECIGLSDTANLPDIWYCSECECNDPSAFGPLRAGQKSALDWFSIDDIDASTPSNPTASNESPFEIGESKLLAIHGFVFCRNSDYSKNDCHFGISQKQRVLNARELQDILYPLGQQLCSRWPIQQVPFKTSELWNTGSDLGKTYFRVKESYDPSIYHNKYLRAPILLEGMRQSKESCLMEDKVLSDVLTTNRLSDFISPNTSLDKRIVDTLRNRATVFDPHMVIKYFLLRIENELDNASLLDEFWNSRKMSSSSKSWKELVRDCISVRQLARLLLQLIDATHHRAFLECWTYSVIVKPKEPNGRRRSEGLVEISKDYSPRDESLRRYWERCQMGHLSNIISKSSKRIPGFRKAFRPGSSFTKRKHVSRVYKRPDSIKEVPTDLVSGTNYTSRDVGELINKSCNEKVLLTNNVDMPRSRRRSEDNFTLATSASSPINIDNRVESQVRRKLSDLMQQTKQLNQREIHWPFAGKKLFDPVGYLPPSVVRRLGRNAGASFAPFVEYTSLYEVGQVAYFHYWRKRVLRCVSYEDLVDLIRMLETYLDKTVCLL
jgi:DDT domain